jgi:hypothetical protein
MVSFMLRPLYLCGKDPDTLGILLCEGFGKEKNYFPLPGLEYRAVRPIVSSLYSLK